MVIDSPSAEFQAIKKVSFCPTAIVYASVPWNNSEQNQKDDIKPDEETLIPLKSCLKSDTIHFRTEMPTNDSTCIGIIIVIFCLFLLFGLVYWILNTLLQIEIERQVFNKGSNQISDTSMQNGKIL